MYREGEITKELLRIKRFEKTFSLFDINDPQLSEKTGLHYIDACPQKANLYPGTFEILEYLQSKYTLHIITNGFEEVQHVKLEKSGLISYFDEIITSEQAGKLKPHPAIFDYALRAAKTNTDECIYIGDSVEVDLIGTKKVGWNFIFFNSQNVEHIENPQWEIRQLSEIMDIL